MTKSPLPPIPVGKRNYYHRYTENMDLNDMALPLQVFQGNRTSVKDLSHGLISYLWFRRIKEIFLLFGVENSAFTKFDMELARQDMIQTCEQYLESERPKDSTDTKRWNEWKNKRLYAETFRMSYALSIKKSNEGKVEKVMSSKILSGGEIPRFDNSIWWYTCKEAPIFNQMNNILRLENFELLMCHRYYISDLCQKIERWHSHNKFTKKQVVYRADQIGEKDFQAMKRALEKKDARITINGFISTSREENVSHQYAIEKLEKNQNMIIIIYEITIDPSIPCSSYADIQQLSFHPEEKEILFNMGATFQIDSIDDDRENNKIKRIKVTARDFQLNLLQEMKNKVKKASQASLSLLLVKYLIELGEDRVCKRYLNQLIESKQLENDSNLVLAYKCLGNIHLRQDLNSEALKLFRKALNVQTRIEFSNNNSMSEIFNYIGKAHVGLGQIEEARENLEEGIRIQKREPKSTQENLASLLSTIGEVYYAQKDWHQAENYFKQAYDLYSRDNKVSHDALEKRLAKANTCLAFGHLKSAKGATDSEVTELFEEALDIFQCILPAAHPKVTETQIEIISEYIFNENFQAVIDYLQKFPYVLNEYEYKSMTSRTDLSNLYLNIGAAYAYEKKFDDAVKCWETAFYHEIQSYFDELLPSIRPKKIIYNRRIVSDMMSLTLENLLKRDVISNTAIGLIYNHLKKYSKVIEKLRGSASLALCDTCISMRETKKAYKVFQRIRDTKQVDNKLQLGLILRALDLPDSDDFIKEIISMKNDLSERNGDNESDRLLMIINDKLAELFLYDKNNFAKCHGLCIESLDLKQRLYSSFHRSLARNYRILGIYHYNKGDFTNSIYFFEKAVEIQLENLPENHAEVCLNYTRLADCYCKTGQIDWSLNFYERAAVYRDDSSGLLRRYSNLCEYYTKKNQYSDAIEKVEEKIELLLEILPKFTTETSVERTQVKKIIKERLNLDTETGFARTLRNIMMIQRCRARILKSLNRCNEEEQDATMIIERSIILHKKITEFQDETDQNLSDIYKELSETYEQLYPTMIEKIRENLQNSLNEVEEDEHHMVDEFRLAKILQEEKNYSAAQHHFKKVLRYVKDPAIHKIVQESLQENNRNLFNMPIEEVSTDFHSNTGETLEDFRNSLSRKFGGILLRRIYEQTNEEDERIIDTSSDVTDTLLSRGDIYLSLGDKTTAMRYFLRAISKLDETIKPKFAPFIVDSSRSPMVEAFYKMLTQWIDDNCNMKQDNDEIQMLRIKVQRRMFYISDTFELKSKIVNEIFQTSKRIFQLPTFFNGMFSLIDSKLKPMKWKNEVPVDYQLRFLFSIGEFYLSKENWMSAFEIYSILQQKINETSALRSAIDFAVAKLLEIHIFSEEKHRPQLESIDLNVPETNVLERLILCQMIIVFMQEMNDKVKLDYYYGISNDLYEKSWIDVNSLDSFGIAQVLLKYEQKNLLHFYWGHIRKIYTGIFPRRLLQSFFEEKKTFDEIFKSASKMVNEIGNNFLLLAAAYELKAELEEKGGLHADAVQSLESSIALYRRISHQQKKILNLEANRAQILESRKD